MKIDAINVIKQEIENKYGRIRHIWSELKSAYPQEKEEMLKELDNLKEEIRQDILQVKYLHEELEGEFSNMF